MGVFQRRTSRSASMLALPTCPGTIPSMTSHGIRSLKWQVSPPITNLCLKSHSFLQLNAWAAVQRMMDVHSFHISCWKCNVFTALVETAILSDGPASVIDDLWHLKQVWTPTLVQYSPYTLDMEASASSAHSRRHVMYKTSCVLKK